MNELPPGWVWTTVGSTAESLVDGPFGSNLKTKHYQSSGVRVIRLQNIEDGFFDDTDKAYISEDHANKLSRHEARTGDVLIAAMGDVLPRVCLVPSNIDRAIVKADCFRLRPCAEVLPEYIAYMLSAPQTRKRASTQIAGIGRPRLNLKKVSSLEIPLPPIDEQSRIVAAIEEQLSRIDAGVAALARVRHNLKLMRAAVLDNPFAALPLSSWETLVSVASIVTGTTPSTADPGNYGGNLPFITPSDFSHGDRISSARRSLSTTGAKSARVLPMGSVLATCIGATLGKVAVADVQCAVNQQINAVVPDKRILSGYLLYCLTRPSFTKLMWTESSSTTMPILNKSRFSALRIPVPSIPEQERIIEEISERTSFIERLSVEIARVEVRVSNMGSAILMAAFSGKLVPQNPSDEPASALLERITAHRVSSSRKGARKPRVLREEVTV